MAEQDTKMFYHHRDYLSIWKPYLDAKAYNLVVNRALKKALADSFFQDRKIRVLDCGTGTGMGLIRLIKDGFLKKACIETFDFLPKLVKCMPDLLYEHMKKNWLVNLLSLRECEKSVDFRISIVCASEGIDIDIHGFSENADSIATRGVAVQDMDLIVGQAFIEHTKENVVYKNLLSLLKTGGLIYFCMNCDGWFYYSPCLRGSEDRDTQVMCLFGDVAMNLQEYRDESGAVSGGRTNCGRLLPYDFRDLGLDVLAFGPSDWVVTPFSQHKYELKFLQYTLDEIREACVKTEGKDGLKAESMREKWKVSIAMVEEWHREKLRAIADRSIGFTCVQKDILGRKK